jgi:hypothetical protein
MNSIERITGEARHQSATSKKVNHETNKVPFHPLVVVAGCCALASAGIVALVFSLLRPIPVDGLWAIAAMAAAPSLMGLGIAYFMTRPPE